MNDRYGKDVLSSDPHRPKQRKSRKVHVTRGLVVEDPSSGFVGAVVRLEKRGGMHVVELEDRKGNRRGFPLGPGFWVDGQPVNLILPRPGENSLYVPARIGQPAGPPSFTKHQRTNSGSRVVAQQRAKVAKASRIWVEGRHDAELVEHVWGDDLRHEGIVVELLEGADHLEKVLQSFQPSTQRRAGVLLDHLVTGSKETYLASEVMKSWGSDALLIKGHPFVDIWQAVKPVRFGLKTWPHIPRGIDWKVGTLKALKKPHQTQADIASGWKYILRHVRDYRDLEPRLLAPVEELIDFVTEPHLHGQEGISTSK